MNTIMFKKMMPFAVFVVGISGAFLTTSMQSSDKAELAPILGYVDANNGGSPCDIPVACDDQGDDLCRQFGDSGPQAKAEDSPTTCAQQVYKPQD